MARFVTLQVFSGRPNPQWWLTPRTCAEFERRLAQLPLAPAETLTPDDALGYHGFSVRGAEGADDSDAIVVFRGRVRTGQQAYLDVGRDFERWLLGTRRTVLDPSLVAYVMSELAN